MSDNHSTHCFQGEYPTTCKYRDENCLAKWKLKEREQLMMMNAFGLGSVVANDAGKIIGLGVPKIAFALGFQNAIIKLYDRGLLDLEAMEFMLEELKPDAQ